MSSSQLPGQDSKPVDDPSELPQINLYGDFIDKVTIVNGTLMSLLVAVGTTPSDTAHEKSVLVPFIELRLDGRAPETEGERLYPTKSEASEAGDRTLLSRTLTLENVAFLILDLVDEFREVSGQLAVISAGGLPVEQARVERCREWLTQAQTSINKSINDLERMGQVGA